MDRYLVKSKPAASIISDKITTSSSTAVDSAPANISECEESQASEEGSSGSENTQETTWTCPSANKRKKTVRKRKFAESWLEHPKLKSWLVKKHNSSFCKFCKKYLNNGLTHLLRHCDTESHIRLAKEIKLPKIDEYFGKQEQKLDTLRKAGHLKMCMFIAEQNLPLSTMDVLPELIKSICLDSAVARSLSCGRHKATQIITNIIAPEHINNISDELKLGGLYYSLIVDESTDVSSDKNLAIVIRYFCGERIRDRFLDLVDVVDATAVGLHNLITECLEKKNIPIQKMIGFAADNASVMMGAKNGLKSKLLASNPNLFVLGCVCHSFALCASAACSELPNEIENFARDVYNYFHKSQLKRRGLEQFQKLLEIQPHKLLKLSQTRWLSLEAVVNRMLEQWPALTLYFQESIEDKSYECINAKNLFGGFTNGRVKPYYLFLSYILQLINKLNVEFQSERVKIHKLDARISDLYRTILRNFIKKEYLESTQLGKINWYNPSNFLQEEHMYFGAEVEIYFQENDVPSRYIAEYNQSCLRFYVKLCQNIRTRFDFDNEVLKFMPNFEPEKALSGTVKSIVPILKLIPSFPCNIETLNFEWRLLADMPSLVIYKDMAIEDFWSKISTLKSNENEYVFENIAKLVKALLSLPQSSANVERIFSQHNLIKTKLRNKLSTKTSGAILHAKDMLKCFNDGNPISSTKWEPSKVLLEKNLEYK